MFDARLIRNDRYIGSPEGQLAPAGYHEAPSGKQRGQATLPNFKCIGRLTSLLEAAR
jgi:hypothetical protein